MAYYTREVLKNGIKSLVEVIRYNEELEGYLRKESEETVKFVVCKDYDGSKAYGSQWDNWSAESWSTTYRTVDAARESAVRYLYGIVEPIVSNERLTEITKMLIDKAYENYDEEFVNGYLKEDFNINEGEADFLGIKERLFPKRYKIVEYAVRRECTFIFKGKVAIPQDADDDDILDYIDDCNFDPMETDPDDSDYEYAEIDYAEVTDEDLSKDDVDGDVVNYDTFDED